MANQLKRQLLLWLIGFSFFTIFMLLVVILLILFIPALLHCCAVWKWKSQFQRRHYIMKIHNLIEHSSHEACARSKNCVKTIHLLHLFLYYPFFWENVICNNIRSLSLFLSPCVLYMSVFFCFFDRTCFECSFILFFEYIRYSTISFSLCRWSLAHDTERTHTRFETIVVSSSESSPINSPSPAWTFTQKPCLQPAL